MARRVALALLVALSACERASEPSCEPGFETVGGACVASCPSGAVRTDEGCVTPGVSSCADGFVDDQRSGCRPVLPETTCGPFEIATPGDVACRAIGVAACGEGFVAKDGGCMPVLPDKCAEGQIAVPGDVACRPIAACGDARYGAATADGKTLFVDASHTGPSDGSPDRPFVTLREAFAALGPSHARIALAEGSYSFGDVIDRDLEIVGRCPSKVRVVQAKDGTSPTAVFTTRKKVTLRGIAIEGAATAINVEGGTTELVGCHVHDTAAEGIFVRRPTVSVVPPRLVLEGSLVERAGIAGIAAYGASEVTVRASVVAGTRAPDTAYGGVGIGGVGSTFGRPTMVVERSLIAGNGAIGVLARGAVARVVRSVVRDTQVPKVGAAAGVYGQAAGTLAPEVTVQQSVVVDNEGYGIAVFDGKLRVEDTTVRGTRDIPDQEPCAAIVSHAPSSTRPTEATILRSLFVDNEGAGVCALGSTLALESSIVRGTRPTKIARAPGIYVGSRGATPAKATIVDVLASANAGSGVSVDSAVVTLERVVLRDNGPNAMLRRDGMGLVAFGMKNQPAPDVTLRRCVVERNHDAGVLGFGAKLTLEATVVRDTKPREGGFLGHGVHASYQLETGLPSHLVLRDSVVSGNAEVAVAVFRSHGVIEGTTVTATRPSGIDKFGDGITVVVGTPGGALSDASLVVSRTTVHGSKRAGLSVFGASLTVSNVLLACNAIDLDAEHLKGGDEARGPSLVDGGGNVCGCEGALERCKAQSSRLEPIELAK